MGKGHHGLVGADHLVDEGGLFGAGLGLLFEEVEGALGDEGGHEEGQGGGHHHPDRHGEVQSEHEAQRPQDGQDAREELGEAHEQAVGELVGIGDDTADRVAHRPLVQIGQGEGLDAGKGIVAETAHHAEGDAVIADIHKPLAQSGEADDEHTPQKQG